VDRIRRVGRVARVLAEGTLERRWNGAVPCKVEHSPEYCGRVGAHGLVPHVPARGQMHSVVVVVVVVMVVVVAMAAAAVVGLITVTTTGVVAMGTNNRREVWRSCPYAEATQ
jgi:hypothetical protein